MPTSFKRAFALSTTGALALIACAVAAPAAAQDAADAPTSDITVTGGVAVVSDYRFRGISFTDEDFAVQPTLTITHSSGLYAGIWGSNLEDSPVFGTVEVDLFAGYATEISPGTTLDVGVTYYLYPDGTNAAGDSDYFEPYASVKTTVGPATVKVGAAYAFDQSAIGNNDNIYVFTDVGVGIPDTPVTLVGHLGYSDGSLSPSGHYLDWALGADLSVAPFTLGVRYIDTDINNFAGVPAIDTLYDSTVLFSIGVNF